MPLTPSCRTMCWSNDAGLRVFHLQGCDARPHFADMARLRIELFREFPYLYQGDVDYEKAYLETYFSCPETNVLLVYAADAMIGFSTSIPLSSELPEIRAPYERCGLDTAEFLYLGEALLETPFRGQGILRVFHEFHENAARRAGKRFTTLMTVDRPDDHPLRPAGHTPMDVLLAHFGYEKLPGCAVCMEWHQADTCQTELNTLSVWLKELRR